MKHSFLPVVFLLLIQTGFSQVSVSYYKGEWTEAKKHTLFTCIFKLSIFAGGEAKAETVWTYQAIDSANNELKELYSGKKGKSGIAFAEGTYSEPTNDLYLEDKNTEDPASILGFDRYHLKLTPGKKVIYGKTEGAGANEGLMFAAKLDNKTGEIEFMKARARVKK